MKQTATAREKNASTTFKNSELFSKSDIQQFNKNKEVLQRFAFISLFTRKPVSRYHTLTGKQLQRAVTHLRLENHALCGRGQPYTKEMGVL